MLPATDLEIFFRYFQTFHQKIHFLKFVALVFSNNIFRNRERVLVNNAIGSRLQSSKFAFHPPLLNPRCNYFRFLDIFIPAQFAFQSEGLQLYFLAHPRCAQ